MQYYVENGGILVGFRGIKLCRVDKLMFGTYLEGEACAPCLFAGRVHSGVCVEDPSRQFTNPRKEGSLVFVEKLPLPAATLGPPFFCLLCTYCKTHLFREIHFWDIWMGLKPWRAIFVDCFLPRPVNVPCLFVHTFMFY